MQKATSTTGRDKSGTSRRTRKASAARSKSRPSRSSIVESLRRELEEAKETLRAITSGEVDALVVAGPQGNQVFTLRDADRPYRHLAQQMSEGACTLSEQGLILFANAFFTRLLGLPVEQVMGTPLARWVGPADQPRFAQLLQQSLGCSVKEEIELVSAAGEPLPVQLSLNRLQEDEGPRVTAVVFDLRERKRSERALRQLNQELEQRVAERTVQLQAANEELEVANEEYKVANEELADANRRLASEIAERKRIEAQLREAERKASDLVKYAPTGIYEIDFRGPRLTRVNEAMCQITGYARDELLATNPFELLNPDSQRRFEARIQATLAGEPVDETVEYTVITKDGRNLTAVLKTRLLIEEGKPIGAFVIAHDITERKRAEQALQESEERFKLSMEATQDGLWDWNIGTDDVYFSPAYYHLLGYENEGFPAKSNSWRERVHPDDRTRALQANQDCIDGRTESFAVEFRMQAKDGTWRWILGRGKCIERDAQGIAIRLVGTHVDVTERKRMEEAIQEAMRRAENNQRVLEAVIEQMPVGVILTDASGAVAKNNQAMDRIWRREMLPTENVDQHSYMAYHPDGRAYRPEEWPLTRSLRHGEEIIGEEMEILRGDGTKGIVYVSSAPIRDNEGKTIAGVVVDVDISERKQAEEHIQQLNRELDQRATELELANRDLESFTYSVSHDLRAPLSSIENFAHLMLDDYGSQVPEEAHRFLQLIRDNAQATNRLVEALLQLSRAGRQPVHRQPVDMRGIVDQIVNDLHPKQGDRQVDWVVGELPTVSADPVLIRQVWTNLLSNAVKYTRDREVARIEIGVEQRAGGPTYFVKDNGVGFDMAQAEKLFGVFQRLHSEEEFEGTDVGLAIVDRIVRRHGGRVWAEAEPDQGATFIFTLS